jgi:CheY-like chemotaxis protein
LGLALVHSIVTKSGGVIHVESVVDKGTTFWIAMPAIIKAVKTKDDDEKSMSLPVGSECIMFIDDEANLVEIGRDILEHLGYRVITQTDPIRALKTFQAQSDQIDLVITDQTMPHMTGDMLAHKFLQLKPDLPVILCTGFSARIDQAKAKEMGIKGFIMKPFVPNELAETVRDVLDHPSPGAFKSS